MADNNTPKVTDDFMRSITAESSDVEVAQEERHGKAWKEPMKKTIQTLTGEMDITEYNHFIAHVMFGPKGIEKLRESQPDHHFVKIYDGDIPMDTMPENMNEDGSMY